MKRVKKFFWRFFPLVVCCCIIFSFSNYAAAASYTAIDYQDYVSDIYYQGDSKMINCLFSWQYNLVQLFDYQKVSLKKENGTYNFFYNLSSIPNMNAQDVPTGQSNYKVFSVVILPLGSSRVLQLSNIPYGTLFDFVYSVSSHHLPEADQELYPYHGAWATIEFQWWDKNMNYISSSTVYPKTELAENWTFSASIPVEMQKPDNASFVRFRVVLDFKIAHYLYDTFHLYPSSLRMRFQESSLMILEEQNQKILDQLGDFVNGTPEQNQQVGAAVDGLENSAGKMEDLAEDMKVDKPDLSGVDVSPDAIVSVADRALLTAPLTKLWKDPTILGMITTVFILVLVSWVFFGKKG